jgi:hypothetical protein
MLFSAKSLSKASSNLLVRIRKVIVTIISSRTSAALNIAALIILCKKQAVDNQPLDKRYLRQPACAAKALALSVGV